MKVSVIVAVYNVSVFLDKCINSIIKLDDRVTEIIFVNDCSTDNSKEIILKYLSKDSRIKLVNHKKNLGLSSARNTGINLSTGDYVMFVDGDDYIISEQLERLLDEVEDNNQPDGVWTGYIREDWNGIHNEDVHLKMGLWEKKEISKNFIPAIIGISYSKLYSWFRGEQTLNEKQEFPTVWRGLYSRRIIKKYHILFNTHVKTGEDILFNHLFYAYADNLYITNCSFYCYVWRKGSLTQDTNYRFYQAKKLLVKERDLQNKQLVLEGKVDMSSEYQGTLVLSRLQMALILSQCKIKDFIGNFKMFIDYASINSVKQAYKNLILKDAPIKYKFVFGIAKLNMNFILFMGGFLLNKMNLHIYPAE